MKHRPALALLSILSLAGLADAQPAREPRHVVQRGSGAWQPRCVATVGCAAPSAVPACPRGGAPYGEEATRSLGAAWDQRFDLAGRTVSIRGRLRANAACTEMACPQGSCCNRCHGSMDLADAARSFALGADDAPAFACSGDDSGLCCGTAVPSGDVIVRGVLRPVPNSGGRWRIESPTLCAY